MKLPPKERLTSLAAVMALAAVLVVLGVLQYRWSREISEATTIRMQVSLHTSLLNWRQDLYRELAQAGDAFQFPATGDDKATLAEAARRYHDARRVAAHPQLFKDVFAYVPAGAGRGLRRLNSASGEFEPAPWPDEFQQLGEWLRRSQDLAALHPRHMNEVGIQQRFVAPEPPGSGPPGEPGRDRIFIATEHGRMRGPAACRIAQDVPALVCPVLQDGGKNAPPRVAAYFLVQLDMNTLREHVFPELTERHFAGASPAYQVAVVTAGPERKVVYTTDSALAKQEKAGAEFAINIFGPPLSGMMVRGAVLPPPISAGDPQVRRRLHALAAFSFMRFEPIHYGPPADWQIVVMSRGGSLEAVAAALQHRNLAISFGVLLVLAATTGILLLTARRAQRLARLQMDFVAGVSHELRTPLTVISSAASNIADGVVDSQQQVIRYGKVIQTQARQLIHLVEQVLLFAATGDGGFRHHLRTLSVEAVVNAALESTAELVSAGGFKVEKQIEPDLPPISGDLVALSQCLQNLITNGVKYGGESRWIGVRASRDGGGSEIQIAVSDKGSGIAADDLEHIFEPFYRGASATAAQIHGTGLGLPLARSIAEAMGGRITVASELNQGSTFVLHLPASGAAPIQPEVAQAAVEGVKVS